LIMFKFVRTKAFTLVELLVVIAIVGFLSTIVLAVTGGISEQGRIAKGLQFSQHLQNALGANAVGIWNLDENPASQGTTILDLSGWNNNGTLNTNNGTTNKSASGIINNALNFDGSGDYVFVPYSPALAPTEAITLTAWFYVYNKDLDSRIFSKTESGGYQISLNEGSACGANVLCVLLNINNSYHKAVYPISNINNNYWDHVAGTYDGETLKLYLNGAEVNVNTSPSGNITYSQNNPLCIGAEPDVSSVCTYSFFGGLIDEVRIYSTALTASQIKSQYYVGLNKLLAKGLMDKSEYEKRLIGSRF